MLVDYSWRRWVWKNWKLMLLVTAVFFVVLQIDYMSKITSKSNDLMTDVSTKHRQHLAVNKILTKWDELPHSKLLKDPQGHSISLRGTRDKDLRRYFPNVNGKFNCFSTKEEIDFVKINDDYCDCPDDGSDEPGTAACDKGIFYCEKISENYPDHIPSYQVNDGVCDCCDGSDEWLQIDVIDTSNRKQLLKYKRLVCKNRC